MTCLFTDIEESTRAWEQQGRAMSAGSASHDAIIAQAAAHNGVHVFKTRGDGYCCASLE
jgi:class 3 adenylate cyclase